MSDPVSPTKVTALGAEELLLFETDETLASAVTVRFSARWIPAGQTAQEVRQWTRTDLVAEPVPVDPKHPPPPGINRFRVRWVVELNHDAEAEVTRCNLGYVILVTGGSGATLMAIPPESIVVDRLTITSNPALTRIMLHEFNRPEEIPSHFDGSPDFEFDPAPLQRYLDGLSAQQKKLLLNYDVSEHDGHRFVVFTTLVKNPVNMMGADFCTDFATSVIANASFAMFHCRGNALGVELVCYTEHLLMNFNYFPAKLMVVGDRGGRKASQWTAKDNPEPVKLKFCCATPALGTEGTHWSIYNRIFNPKTGVDEMKGNTMHGMINTKGCWMLFRNYNWPRAKFQEFSDVMTDIVRIDLGRKRAEQELARIGYDRLKPVPAGTIGPDGKPVPQRSSSYAKFLAYDTNSAFHWFCHELLGIRYFSRDEYWNEHAVHGRFLEASFPVSEANRKPAFNLPEELDYSSYFLDDRFAEDRKLKRPLMKLDAGCFRKNVLGFQPVSGFCGLGASPATRSVLKASSWGDLYIYSEPGVALNPGVANPPRRPSTIPKPPKK